MESEKIGKGLFICVVVMFLILLPCMGHTAIPQKINHQGYLTTSAGVPVNGAVQVIFSIYNVSAGGSALWTETQNVTVTHGVYNVELGDVAPINLSFDVQYYLGIKVGTDPEMAPRIPLTSVGYAFRAQTVETVGSHTHSGGDITTGTVFEARIDPLIARDSEVTTAVNAHASRTDNPHSTTAAQVGAVGSNQANSITSSMIVDGAVGTNDLANSSVTKPKLSVTGGTAGQVLSTDGINLLWQTPTSPAPAWSLTGNAGTDSATNFLGTTDNQELRFRINNVVAYRMLPNATSPNLIGGHSGNWATPGVYGATIGGGGENAANNRITDNYGTIGGGRNNQAGDNAGSVSDRIYSTVGGGSGNTASGWTATVGGGASNTASGPNTTVGGGASNTASGIDATVGGGAWNITTGDYATVGGGSGNSGEGPDSTVGGGTSNTASGPGSTVGGGTSNTASGPNTTVGGGDSNAASVDYATVGGGIRNKAFNFAATVGGGSDNTVNGDYATVGGGGGNTASALYATVGGGGNNNTASGQAATVGGGSNNTASGDYATVGGGYANTTSGSWSAVPGGFSNLAQGDFSFAAGRRAKANNQGCFVWGDSTSADISCDTNNGWVSRVSGGVVFYTNSGLTAGVTVYAGGSSWSSVSDRNLKENFSSVDRKMILARLLEIPIATWNYKSQAHFIRHMGPVAQDFSSAFGLGESDKHINTIDIDGVALASIQGLYQIVKEKEEEIEKIARENRELREAIKEINRRLAGIVLPSPTLAER